MSRGEIARLLDAKDTRAQNDLTRQTTLLAVGSGSRNLIPGGQLTRRLTEARKVGLPVVGEARLLAQLRGETGAPASVPRVRAAQVSNELSDLLNAFDLIALEGDHVRFDDADMLRNAAKLESDGLELAEIIRALESRRAAPKGRHRLSTDAQGRPVLLWEDGVTTLSGQGVLPLDEGDSLDDLFEAGLVAEAEGDLEAAARAYSSCVQIDRRDPIAAFNLGNVQVALGDDTAARLSYLTAIARDPRFAEAHFNLAGVLERQGEVVDARRHLVQAIEADGKFADPVYNLAQLALAADDRATAEAEYRRFLTMAPDNPLAQNAKRALNYLSQSK